ncbi:unnamed protein product [Clonostachys rosea]|uniref:Phosphatidic acid phosphatase type 2/haloperoxidase domain-containing protein n=1 Tax=Bionectria ochroleuca TaxID=29856 RepID=A0ABY6UXJ1_BIOOC|nr:unnamed protein product [Clonostachys rosea]
MVTTAADMDRSTSFIRSQKRRFPLKVVLSYIFDWIVLVILALVALAFEFIQPNKRPFSLNDPNISFPFTEHETVPTWLLVVLSIILPLAVVAIVALLFVPGATVPKGTPQSLVWRRKLWEFHVGWLGLALALISAWFFTQGMKNMFGKPRPDLLARCIPDLDNMEKYVVGGFSGEDPLGRLYSAAICQQTSKSILRDGFRSFPSGHSSLSAAGLVYLSLFLASKFAVTIPFVVPSAGPNKARDHSAFPSRGATETAHGQHNAQILSTRRQAAAPPIYLLAITLAPFCVSIFIAASRWWNFRHHGFDILFGYLMGLLCSVYSFRYYHLPIQRGAGWAWGARSSDRAFWAGVGRVGYAKEPEMSSELDKPEQHSDGTGRYNADIPPPPMDPPSHMTHRPTASTMENDAGYSNGGQFRDVEMQRMQ